MGSRLDDQMNAVVDTLTAPGEPFEVGTIVRRGASLPAFVRAPATLPELFARYCAEYGPREFLVDGEQRLTFGEIHALARRVATGLVTRHGVRHGDCIGIAARNSASWIVAYMGALMAGGCVALVNGWWSAEEMAGGIALAECSLVLADDERAERLASAGVDVAVLRIGHDDVEAGLAEIAVPVADDSVLPALTGDDLATIVFTSGSTGISKGAASDHLAVVQSTMGFAFHYNALAGCFGAVNRGDGTHHSMLLGMPLFHVAGEIALMLASLIIGRRLVLMPRWDALEAMTLIDRERVTAFFGVPLMSLEMATHPRRSEYDLSTCVLMGAGGSAAPAEHITQVRAALPTTIPLLGYGLTETNSIGCCNFGENYLAKPGSTGPVMRPLVDVVVLGPGHEQLPAGLRGEIAVRSVANIREYWRNPIETEAAFTAEGYFLTGDIGYLDEDGYLFVVDRKKDIIIRGGENISCLEVEQAIYTHDAIAEASVFGMPHPRYGEVPVAVFMAKPDTSLSEEDLRDHLQRHVAAFKVPVRLWSESGTLPRLGSQKIDKRALKARYSREWEAAKAAS